jgi:hypothetical protein
VASWGRGRNGQLGMHVQDNGWTPEQFTETACALLDRGVELVNLLTRKGFSSGNSIGDIDCALFS